MVVYSVAMVLITVDTEGIPSMLFILTVGLLPLLINSVWKFEERITRDIFIIYR